MHIIHSLDPPYLYRPLGFLRLHHGASPTRVYELVGHREGLDPKLISKLAGFEAAYEAYRRQSWDHAAMLFQAVDEATQGGDTASRVYLAKCKAAGKQVSLGVTPGNFSKDGIEGAIFIPHAKSSWDRISAKCTTDTMRPHVYPDSIFG